VKGPEPVPSSASSKTNERDEFYQGLSMEDDHLGGGYLAYPGKMRLRVCEREWKKFKEDMSKIPLYLLRYLKIHDDENMTLRPADLLYRPGKQFVIEDITKEGAIFLLTCNGQSDLAFPVTGYNLVAFPSGKFVISGQVVQHTQYVVEFPQNYIRNILYPVHPKASSCNQDSHSKKTIGEMVRYSVERKHATAFSFQVFVIRDQYFKFCHALALTSLL